MHRKMQTTKGRKERCLKREKGKTDPEKKSNKSTK